MATSHRENAAVAIDNSAIYMSIEGYVGLLPWPNPDDMTDEQRNTAIAVGVQYDALRGAQTAAKKAKEDGKDVREAINAYLAAFKPSAKREVKTVASKREELARGLLRESLVGSGKNADLADDDALLARFGASEKHSPRIDAAVAAWASAYTAPKPRKSGAAGSVDTSSVDVDEL